MRSEEPQSSGFLVSGSNCGINSIATVKSEKPVLSRNAPAASLCKCEKRNLAKGRAKPRIQETQTTT